MQFIRATHTARDTFLPVQGDYQYHEYAFTTLCSVASASYAEHGERAHRGWGARAALVTLAVVLQCFHHAHRP
jgi:hypothetical protein